MNQDTGECSWQKPDAVEQEAVKVRDAKVLKAARILQLGKVEAARKLAQAAGVLVDDLPDMVNQIHAAERKRAERKTFLREELLRGTAVTK